MKRKSIFKILGLSSLVLAGALFVSQSVQGQEAKEVKAATDLGTFTFADANDDSALSFMYAINWTENIAPAGWDTAAFTPVGEESGTFINDVRVGAEIKKIGPNTYYVAVTGASEGSVVTVKGSWANNDYSFSVNEFSRQWFASKWIYPLENYDVVSLADANMPDFENVAINTEDAPGYEYVTDPAGLPKKKGFFGLTNSTNSYAFQFKFTKTVVSAGWFDIRIGGSGSWGRGHLLKFSISNEWGFPGPGFIYEYTDSGDIWNPTEVQKSPEFSTGLTSGENLMEIGAIRVKNLDLYYVFFKNNGVVKYGAYWNLSDSTRGGRTTKVGFYYANADVSVKNSLEPESVRLPSVASYVDTVVGDKEIRQLYFNMSKDACPAVNNWDDYFMPVVADNLTLNGSSVGYSNWNYFKKTGSTQMFLALSDIGITPVQGNILYIGGMFKAARTVNGVKVLFKINFADSYFQFDGEKWIAFNPNYSVADFSYNLLKMTCNICSASDDGNHDVLAAVWTTLSGEDHYGQLTDDQKTELGSAVADPTVEVPTVVEEIEDLLPEEAIGAAMYRYEHCTAKYSLTNFIQGRTVAPYSSLMTILSKNIASNIPQIVAIIISSTLIVALGISFYIVKRKEK